MSPIVRGDAAAPTTTRAEIDAAVGRLRDARARWRDVPPGKKAALLRVARRRLAALARPWAEASCAVKRVPPDSRAAGEEWLAVAFLIEGMRMLADSLEAVAAGRSPRIPGAVRTTPTGQLAVEVFPQRYYHRVFYPGMRVAIWTEPGVDRDTLAREPVSRFEDPRLPRVALVLGAGNVSLLGPTDLLNRLFVEGDVVVYKPHALTDPLTPLLTDVFAGVMREGALEVVTGGVAEGAYLAAHRGVEAIHMTATHTTFDALVFGTGAEGAARKAAGRRLNERPVTAELGNISPVIVVPGPWSLSDLAYQSEHLAGMQVVNAGFNCLTTRLLIQHAGWSQRHPLLDGVRAALARTPTRYAFYDSAAATQEAFAAAHPEAEHFGRPPEGHLPWMLIPDVDPTRTDDICFTREPFCPLFSETALDAPDTPAFLDRAVHFANDVLWGTLTTTILVHPASLRDRRVAEAVERAVAELRYGTVGVNVWGVMNYGTMAGSWGAFPGHRVEDIQSGCGTVHNYLLVPRPQKTVIRGPFRQRPKPLVFPGHRTLLPLSRCLTAFVAEPSPLNLARILGTAMRG